MNIDDAARVLNEHKYRGVSGWHAFDHDDGTVVVYGENHGLGADVAIAIAEKLERQAGRDMPTTREFMRSLESWAKEAGVENHGDSATLDLVIKMDAGELRALLGEWGRKA